MSIPRSSLSPTTLKHSLAFHWPPPPSPSDNTHRNTDITVKEILEQYSDDAELLKYILTAKSEEDKKNAARDILKTEEARIYMRQMDVEYARIRPSQSTGCPVSAHPSVTYYGLAPVQQQVLARFNPLPPPSPSNYPHSAHPLCVDKKFRQLSPTSFEPMHKRPKIVNEQQDKISHNKVMEALKAKIQRTTTNKEDKPLLPPIDTSLGRIIESDSILSNINTRRASSPLSTSSSTTTTTSSTTSSTTSGKLLTKQ